MGHRGNMCSGGRQYGQYKGLCGGRRCGLLWLLSTFLDLRCLVWWKLRLMWGKSGWDVMNCGRRRGKRKGRGVLRRGEGRGRGGWMIHGDSNSSHFSCNWEVFECTTIPHPWFLMSFLPLSLSLERVDKARLKVSSNPFLIWGNTFLPSHHNKPPSYVHIPFGCSILRPLHSWCSVASSGSRSRPKREFLVRVPFVL